MTERIRQAAWIHGLLGKAKRGGLPVEVLNLKPPQPKLGQLSFILKTTTDVTTMLRDLSSTKRTISRLSLVVRTDAKSESDLAYHMADARIVSVQTATSSCLPNLRDMSLESCRLYGR